MHKVVIKRPHKTPVIAIMNLELSDLQSIVGGHIEAHPFPPDLSADDENQSGITIIMNKEGKLEGLDVTMKLVHEWKTYDVTCGSIIFCSVDDEGETIGLTDEQVSKALEYLRVNQLF